MRRSRRSRNRNHQLMTWCADESVFYEAHTNYVVSLGLLAFNQSMRDVQSQVRSNTRALGKCACGEVLSLHSPSLSQESALTGIYPISRLAICASEYHSIFRYSTSLMSMLKMHVMNFMQLRSEFASFRWPCKILLNVWIDRIALPGPFNFRDEDVGPSLLYAKRHPRSLCCSVRVPHSLGSLLDIVIVFS